MPNTSQIQQLYIAYYGRPADPGGLAYWTGRLEENGGNLGEVISAFATSDEFEDRFGSLTEEELVNNMYQQILGRPAEPEGLEFYVGMLARGDSSLIELALDITNGAGGTDAITIQNRVEVANKFTQDLAERGLDYGTIEAAGQIVANVAASTNVNEYIQSAVNELLDTLPASDNTGPAPEEPNTQLPSQPNVPDDAVIVADDGWMARTDNIQILVLDAYESAQRSDGVSVISFESQGWTGDGLELEIDQLNDVLVVLTLESGQDMLDVVVQYLPDTGVEQEFFYLNGERLYEDTLPEGATDGGAFFGYELFYEEQNAIAREDGAPFTLDAGVVLAPDFSDNAASYLIG